MSCQGHPVDAPALKSRLLARSSQCRPDRGAQGTRFRAEAARPLSELVCLRWSWLRGLLGNQSIAHSSESTPVRGRRDPGRFLDLETPPSPRTVRGQQVSHLHPVPGTAHPPSSPDAVPWALGQ